MERLILRRKRRRQTEFRNREYLILRSAYQCMLNEVRRCSVETGGAMVGVFHQGFVIVLMAGAGGDDAVRKPTLFKTDVAADRHCLERARSQFGPAAGVVGGYHKHPSGMSHFSGQDLAQAREMKRHYPDQACFLVAIFTEMPPNSEPQLFLYGIDDPNGNLEPLECEIVDDNDPRVAEALRSAPGIVPLRNTQFWTDPQFSFHENSIGRARIRDDVAALKSFDLNVNVGQRPNQRGLIVLIQLSHGPMEIRLPAEYPLNPPRVILPNRGEFRDLDVVRHWNSSRTLLDVIRESLQILQCPRCANRHLSPEMPQTRKGSCARSDSNRVVLPAAGHAQDRRVRG